MGDEIEGLAKPAASVVGSALISWPLVERRRPGAHTPPDGYERRGPRFEATTPGPLTIRAAPLWPFRLAALAGAVIRAATQHDWRSSTLIVSTVVISAYTVVSCIRPVPYRDDNRVRMRIVIEQALSTALILVTGTWASPFALCLIPTGMLAGFASGGWFSARIAAASAAAITVQHVQEVGVRHGLEGGAVWIGLLGLVAFTSGLANRAALDAAHQQRLALDRVSMLARANSLLFALQRVAQTLPASLDLDEVLDSTVGRVSAMLDHDALAVFLLDEHDGSVTPIRTNGFERVESYMSDELPAGLRAAIHAPKTVRHGMIPEGGGVSPTAHSGLYAALRARGATVGLIAVEADVFDAFGPQQAEVLYGLTEPFGIAIDNARMFRQIRTLAADEERSRIARDLHDHIGSSLALIGFEVDRASAMVDADSLVEPVLRELRDHVSAVVADVRDALYDLRSEVTDAKHLGELVDEYLARVSRRSEIAVDSDIRITGRLPLLQERELWQIVREAINNAERHSQAALLEVTIVETDVRFKASVRDDGIGLVSAAHRADSYGMMGMRERAARIGASIAVRTPAHGGTEIKVELKHDLGDG